MMLLERNKIARACSCGSETISLMEDLDMLLDRKISIPKVLLGCLVFIAALRVLACPKPLSSSEIVFVGWAIGILATLCGLKSNTKQND
jgi:hypothetical protein